VRFCRAAAVGIVSHMVRLDGSRMNIFLGIMFLYFAFSYLQDAMNPNRLTRSRVQMMAGVLAIMSAFIGLVMLFGGGGA